MIDFHVNKNVAIAALVTAEQKYLQRFLNSN